MPETTHFAIDRDFPRLWSIRSGCMMVVTDLHGDWDAYAQTRDLFLSFLVQGDADALIFTGDIIHRDPDEGPDRSIDIVLDILRMRDLYGDRIICLLGNHEMPHIYTTTLARGKIVYSTPFEIALSETGTREQIVSFFSGLPFYLRTTSGVALAHAGAANVLAHPQSSQALFEWNHLQLLQQAQQILAEKGPEKLRASFAQMYGVNNYPRLVSEQFGMRDPNNPHFDDPLRGFMVTLTPAYQILWAALFTRCEKEYGKRYPEILDHALVQISQNFTPQHILVTGHIGVPGGVEAINGGAGGSSQIRIASATHALPRQSGRYLLFDAGTPIQHASDLLNGVQSLS